MTHFFRPLAGRLGLASVLAGWSLIASAAYDINLQPPVTPIGREIYELHNHIVLVCLAIFVVVFIPMGIALSRHRKALGHVPARFHENLPLEIIWTIIPVLILVAMAWPATRTVIAMKDTTAPDLTIKVTGHQWNWEYEYPGTKPGEEVRFFSSLATPRDQLEGSGGKGPNYLLEVDQHLVVPTGRKVRLLLTSTDVIHSWWVPALGVKQDTIPGFIRDTWFQVDQPGIYRGQCAELCGVGHAYMPVVIEAVPPERYDAWLGAQRQQALAAKQSIGKTFALAELVAQGEKVYTTHCISCHQANGAGIPGAFPALNGSAIVKGPKAAHIDRVFHGKPGTAMAAFGKQLSDLEVAAVVTYERNAWDNRVGDMVQPAEVAALHP